MRTKILVIFISFIFLFTYTIQCFAVENTVRIDNINEEINNNTKGEETNDFIKDNFEDEISTEKNVLYTEDKKEITNEEKNNDEVNQDKLVLKENINIEDEIKNSNIDNQINIGNNIGYAGLICIDSPVMNQMINIRNNGNIIKVCGWAVSNTFGSNLQCLIDNNIASASFKRFKREDVDRLISPSYGGTEINKEAGYECTIDIGFLDSGKHSFKIRELSPNNELICEKEIFLNIENPPYIRKYMYRYTLLKSNFYKTR